MTYCSQLIDVRYPAVDIHDNVSHVLEAMTNYHTETMPVLNGLQFIGLVSEEDLIEQDAETTMDALQESFIKSHVYTTDHFLIALRLRSKHYIDIIPVLNEKNEWEGIIGSTQLLDTLSAMCGVSGNGSLLVLDISRIDYALGEINRLVESNDAMIMQVNTIPDPLNDHLQIVIRINKEDISDVVATFQRHEYHVVYFHGEETYQNSLQSNLDHLLNYLNI